MSFAVVPGRFRNKGIVIWSGAVSTGWPSIHYVEFIIHDEHFQRGDDLPPQTVFEPGRVWLSYQLSPASVKTDRHENMALVQRRGISSEPLMDRSA